MTFTFRMRFSGLCVFVPERPFSEADAHGGNVGPVAVLLRNLTVPEKLVSGAGLTDPHFPLLEFDPRNRRPTSTRDGDFSSHSSIFDGRSYCFLRGEALRILIDGNGAQGAGVTTPRYDFHEPTSLTWVAEMAQVFPNDPNLVKIKSAFLTQMPDGDSDTATILARLDLDQGRLSTSRLSDGKVDIVQVQDRQQPANPLDGSFPRRVAIELLLEIPGCEEEVVIEMQRRDEGTDFGAHQLVLGPATGDPTDNVVEVQLHHREIDGFIGVPLNYLERKDKADFQVYYELSAQRPVPEAELTVRPQPPGSTPAVGTDHTGRCPPTAMAGTRTG
jgi:hypothetical protein